MSRRIVEMDNASIQFIVIQFIVTIIQRPPRYHLERLHRVPNSHTSHGPPNH